MNIFTQVSLGQQSRGPRHQLGPFWPILFANPFYVRAAHRRGQPVCPLDPHPDSRLWYYRWLGVDAVLTNNTGATLHALGRG